MKVLLSNLLSHVIVEAGYLVGNTYLREKKSIFENEGYTEQQQAGRDDPDMP